MKDERDTGSVPGSERSPGGGNDNLLQYSCLDNSMGRGAWQAVHTVTKSQRLNWATSSHALVLLFASCYVYNIGGSKWVIMRYFNFLISCVFDISCVKTLSVEKRETEEQRRVTPEIMKSGEQTRKSRLNYKNQYLLLRSCIRTYLSSFYPLKRPKDNHKLKTTPLELRNLTILRYNSHQSKLSLLGTKKLIPGNVQDIPGSVQDES